MKKNIFTPLFFLLAFINVNAQEFTGSLLWEISGNGLQKPSYIMGTNHFAPLDILDSRPEIMEKLNESEQIIGELAMDDMNAIQQEMTPKMLLPDSISYNNLLSEEDCKQLDSLLIKKLGNGLQQLGRLKPAALSLMYTILIYAKETNIDFSKSTALDIHFQQEGTKHGKPTIGLETATDQINALFETSSQKEQAELLLCTLKAEGVLASETQLMFELYENEDLNGMYKLFENPETSCQMSEVAKNALNKNRNKNWLAKLPQLMADNSSFIAVGCLHLAGEDGLLYNLHKMGYTVTAVK